MYTLCRFRRGSGNLPNSGTVFVDSFLFWSFCSAGFFFGYFKKINNTVVTHETAGFRNNVLWMFGSPVFRTSQRGLLQGVNYFFEGILELILGVRRFKLAFNLNLNLSYNFFLFFQP